MRKREDVGVKVGNVVKRSEGDGETMWEWARGVNLEEAKVRDGEDQNKSGKLETTGHLILEKGKNLAELFQKNQESRDPGSLEWKNPEGLSKKTKWMYEERDISMKE